jgi:signal transduction histidine kinase
MRPVTLRVKLCVGMLSVSFAVIGLCLGVLAFVVEDLAREEVASSLETGPDALQELLQLRWSLITSQGQSIAQAPHLRAVMSIPDVDHETLYHTMRPLYDAVDADLILAVDPNGKLLIEISDADERAPAGGGIADLMVLMEQYRGLWFYSGQPYEIVAVPVSVGDHHLGHLILGNRLDAAAADYISAVTGTDIIMAVEGETIAQSRAASGGTSFDLLEVETILQAMVDEREEGRMIAARGGDEHFLARQSQIAGGEVTIVFVRSLAGVEEKLSDLRWWIVIGGLVLAALSLLFSVLISGRVAQPVRKLTEAAEQIRRGARTERVSVESQDEVGQLAASFNAMVDGLATAQDHLTEANRSLETRVEDRTADLARANSRLQTELTERRAIEEAHDEAERQLANQRAGVLRSDRLRSLGEMAAGIAHELNQPLTGVRGLAEHLLLAYENHWEQDQKQIEDRLRRIVTEADRMTHIIEHVRLFARDAGKPEVDPVQVNDVVASSIQMLEAQFRSQGIELATRLQDDLPPVLANAFSLEEVLLNLLSNARDAIADSTTAASVVIQTRRSQNAVAIEVVDNGHGIPQDIAARVFDPFFTTKDPDQGTGLGLSISKGIIEELGGSISIESVAGAGTTVRIELPLIEAQNQTQAP